MRTKRSHEGYVLIDHSDSPGVNTEFVGANDTPAVPKGMKYESATFTCSHCQRGVILQPLRTRERGWCSGCDHYICDVCYEVRRTSGCVTMRQVLDEMYEKALRV